MSQKAGSYKSFHMFVKMLASAFSKESDSVYVDILTYSDLEMIKARQLGSMSTNSNSLNTSKASITSSKSPLKRYIILTYAAEFDRVHFPLPLAFQDDSNIDSLKRSIARLRKRLKDQSESSSIDPDKSRLV